MHDKDVYRDTIIRYTAFASDLGEALKPFISKKAYLVSYAIVVMYSLADTTSKGLAAYWNTNQTIKKHDKPKQPRLSLSTSSTSPAASLQSRQRMAPSARVLAAAPTHLPSPKELLPLTPVTATVVDSLLWHAAASLILPGIVINRTVWATSTLLSRKAGLNMTLKHSIPSLVGLCVIPLVVPHIDDLVTQVMDDTVRPFLRKKAN